MQEEKGQNSDLSTKTVQSKLYNVEKCRKKIQSVDEICRFAGPISPPGPGERRGRESTGAGRAPGREGP